MKHLNNSKTNVKVAVVLPLFSGNSLKMSTKEYQRLPEETDERNSRSPGHGSLGQSNERSPRSIHDDDRDRHNNNDRGNNSRDYHGNNSPDNSRNYPGNSPGNHDNSHGPSTDVSRRGSGDIEAGSPGGRDKKTNDPSDEPGVAPSWSYLRRQLTSHCVLVVALLIINAAQLKTLVLAEEESRDALWSASIVLVALSLALLTCLTILITLTGLHRVFSREHMVVSGRLTDVTVLCSVLVLICNIFTTVIGLTLI